MRTISWIKKYRNYKRELKLSSRKKTNFTLEMINSQTSGWLKKMNKTWKCMFNTKKFWMRMRNIKNRLNILNKIFQGFLNLLICIFQIRKIISWILKCLYRKWNGFKIKSLSYLMSTTIQIRIKREEMMEKELVRLIVK